MYFKNSENTEDKIISKEKDGEGRKPRKEGIETIWIEKYAEIAERSDKSGSFGLNRYHYDPRPAVKAFIGR